MRNAFADEITRLAERDPRIVLCPGDIGNRLFNTYKSKCPGRFYNCGVAEQNLIGVAAGLAMSGMRPVAYTIVPFLTTRVLEQIRVDVCYHHLPVVIVGVGGGLSYASLGATHHSCEDIAFLRMLPGMTRYGRTCERIRTWVYCSSNWVRAVACALTGRPGQWPRIAGSSMSNAPTPIVPNISNAAC